jgi:glyoxylase-like metal-dependent hydrolase (beta-lactamase superfamily II)
MKTIPFDTSERPWFGPRKRAREVLAHRSHVLPPAAAVSEIAEILGSSSSGVQRIRFIDYANHDENDYRYTIALVWTDSNAVVRNKVYDAAVETVQRTGWYPLPQGERLDSRNLAREFTQAKGHRRNHVSVRGKLQSISNAVKADGGCSIRVKTDNDSFLLDSGLPDCLEVAPHDRCLLLSHTHLDHCGGVVSGRIGRLPIIMSPSSAQIMVALSRLSGSVLSNQVITFDPKHTLPIGSGITVRMFPVPHCPGAVGFNIFQDDVSIVFSGDIAIRTARHDFSSTLLSEVLSTQAERKIVLVDATMAGRSLGATDSNAAADVLASSKQFTDVILFSTDVEQLLYAYVDLFFCAKEHATLRYSTEFFVTNRLRPVFEVLHSAFILRQRQTVDPFILAQYGTSMSAWGESRWLYWCDPGTSFVTTPDNLFRLWFVVPEEATLLQPRGDVAHIGIGRLQGATLETPYQSQLLPVDASAWALHSDEDSLCETVRTLSKHAKVVLFHNFERRIRTFMRKNGLNCECLSGELML